MFIVEYPDGSYMPLDERVMGKLFLRSVKRWGNMWEYFLSMEREMERDKEIGDKDHKSHMDQGAGDYFDFMKIKVGYGKSSGSKFADYHQD